MNIHLTHGLSQRARRLRLAALLALTLLAGGVAAPTIHTLQAYTSAPAPVAIARTKAAVDIDAPQPTPVADDAIALKNDCWHC